MAVVITITPTNMVLTLTFYLIVAIVAYLLSLVVSDRTPPKVMAIATVAASIAQLVVSGMKLVIQP